jgi:hypothetical protein
VHVLASPRPYPEENGEGQEDEDYDERDVHLWSPSLLAGSSAYTMAMTTELKITQIRIQNRIKGSPSTKGSTRLANGTPTSIPINGSDASR